MLIIDVEKCVGCAQCVPFCFCGALKVWGVAEVNREECTDCRECVAYCPVDALEVVE